MLDLRLLFEEIGIVKHMARKCVKEPAFGK